MNATAPAWFLLLAGAALLLAGRRLFWLFVGLVGFFAGLRFALGYLGGQPETVQWLVAGLAGLVGVFLAFTLQRLAVAFAGFIVGGLFAARLLGVDLAHLRPGPALLCLLAGVLAALLALLLFQGALILLSSLAGAGLVLDALHVRQGAGGVLFLILLALGIAVQAGWTARGAPPPRRRSAFR